MFKQKGNHQFNEEEINQLNFIYKCTCQFFFDHINQMEQIIIQNNNDKQTIDQTTLKLNIVAIYLLLKQANFAKDCLMLWQWKITNNQTVYCTLIGYDHHNKINILAINFKNWLITDRLETITNEEENDQQTFIHPYDKSTNIHQIIKTYLTRITNNINDIVLRSCIYLPFYDFRLNNPENFKTSTGPIIFNSKIINLLCNYNFNINTNFFYANNNIFLMVKECKHFIFFLKIKKKMKQI